MSKVMMLVTDEGVTLAESRIDGAADRSLEAALRDEALTSGFSEDEVRAAKVVVVGGF